MVLLARLARWNGQFNSCQHFLMLDFAVFERASVSVIHYESKLKCQTDPNLRFSFGLTLKFRLLTLKKRATSKVCSLYKA